jgi:hypothetical protein
MNGQPLAMAHLFLNGAKIDWLLGENFGFGFWWFEAGKEKNLFVRIIRQGFGTKTTANFPPKAKTSLPPAAEC